MKPSSTKATGVSTSRSEQTRQSERSGKASSFIYFEQMHDPQPMPHQGIYLDPGMPAVVPASERAAKLAAEAPVLITAQRDERHSNRPFQPGQRTKRS